MRSIVDLTDCEALARVARPANLRLGQDIVDQGGVELTRLDSLHVNAKVGGVAAADQRRTVELIADSAGLRWSCTCSRRNDLFCKHTVAAALAARRRG